MTDILQNLTAKRVRELLKEYKDCHNIKNIERMSKATLFEKVRSLAMFGGSVTAPPAPKPKPKPNPKPVPTPGIIDAATAALLALKKPPAAKPVKSVVKTVAKPATKNAEYVRGFGPMKIKKTVIDGKEHVKVLAANKKCQRLARKLEELVNVSRYMTDEELASLKKDIQGAEANLLELTRAKNWRAAGHPYYVEDGKEPYNEEETARMDAELNDDFKLATKEIELMRRSLLINTDEKETWEAD